MLARANTVIQVSTHGLDPLRTPSQQSFPLPTLGLSLAFVLLVGSCSREGKQAKAGVLRPPVTTSGSEEWPVDLNFAIEGRKKMADGGEQLVAVGVDEKREVGFRVTLGPKWTATKMKRLDLTMYQGVVRIESLAGRFWTR